jgi:hypothetical protein
MDRPTRRCRPDRENGTGRDDCSDDPAEDPAAAISALRWLGLTAEGVLGGGAPGAGW